MFTTSESDCVLVAGVRTPFGKFGGVLRDVPSMELGATVIRELLKRTDLDGEAIDEAYIGSCMQGETALCGNTVGRQTVLKAGLPSTMPSMLIDRACCSSLSAVQLAVRAIRCGEAEVVLTVGQENMSRIPLLLAGSRWGAPIGNLQAKDVLFELGFEDYNPLAVDVGEVALEYGEDRVAQDEWAVRSQQRHAAAEAAGRFNDERMAITVPQPKGPPVVMETDEGPRPDTTLEKLAVLPTVYGSPTVTAGNAPGLNTGASANLVMTRRKARALGLPVLATIVTYVSSASAPRYMASAPAAAIQRLLKRSDLQLDDLNLIEINEAFAALPLVSSRILVDGDEARLERLRERINVNGGAIAIGHPVGASGGRLLLHSALELQRRGGGWGVASLCGGLAQADACLIRVD